MMQELQVSQARLAQAAAICQASTEPAALSWEHDSGMPPIPQRFSGAVTPRQKRILGALLSGPLWREELDRLAGASNGPDLVFQLRKRGLHKDTGLVCEMLERTDRDGQTVECGRYSLTPEGRRLVLDWVERARLDIVDDLLYAKGR